MVKIFIPALIAVIQVVIPALIAVIQVVIPAVIAVIQVVKLAAPIALPVLCRGVGSPLQMTVGRGKKTKTKNHQAALK